MTKEITETTNTVPMESPFSNIPIFEQVQRMAKLLSSSRLVPKTFQGELADCVIAIEIAHRLKVSPLSVLQNIYIVQGKPSFSAKFMISAFNASPDFGSIRYEYKGEEGKMDRGCRARAVDKATGEMLYGPWITMSMAKAEGWFSKSGSKWQTMPEKMLMYRSAAWFIDTIAPELMLAAPDMGGEIIDVEPIVVDPGKKESILSQSMGEIERRQESGENLGPVVTVDQAAANEKPEAY